MRTDLSDPEARRIAEAFGCEINIDGKGPKGIFRHGATSPKPTYRRLIVTTHRPEKDQDDHDRLCKLVTHAMQLPKDTRFNIFITTDELLTQQRNDKLPLL